MQTIKVTTHWTADQAVYICEFLDELKQSIMTTYSDEIEQMTQELREDQLKDKEQQASEDWFDDEIPF